MAGLAGWSLKPREQAQALRGLGLLLAQRDDAAAALGRPARAATHLARDGYAQWDNPEALSLHYAIALELLVRDGFCDASRTRYSI